MSKNHDSIILFPTDWKDFYLNIPRIVGLTVSQLVRFSKKKKKPFFGWRMIEILRIKYEPKL